MQNATVDELYNKVFEKLSGDMSSDANVDDLRLFAAGMCLYVWKFITVNKIADIDIILIFIYYHLGFQFVYFLMSGSLVADTKIIMIPSGWASLSFACSFCYMHHAPN